MCKEHNLEQVLKTGMAVYAEENSASSPTGKCGSGTWLTPVKDTAGDVTAVLGISRDISERKRAEEERERLPRPAQCNTEFGCRWAGYLQPHRRNYPHESSSGKRTLWLLARGKAAFPANGLGKRFRHPNISHFLRTKYQRVGHWVERQSMGL